jgi:hypothetical protein
MAKAKSPKFSKHIATIDRRTSKDRRDVPAVKSSSKKTAAKAAKSKKVVEREIVAETETTEPVETYSPKLERREKVNRRRQIDPTTCEREYSDEEVEFMQALDLYKRQNGRMFPTCSEVLEVIRNLGYVKVPAGMTLAPIAQPNVPATTVPSPYAFESNNDFDPAAFAGASAVVEQPYFG